MTSARRIGIQAGLVGGLIFFLHALIPYSRSYPFVWPLLTGAVAAWRATAGVTGERGRHGMLAVLIAGLVVGAVALAGSAVTVVTLKRSIGDTMPTGGTGATSAVALALTLVAVFAVVATWVGGAVVLPFRLRRASAAT